MAIALALALSGGPPSGPQAWAWSPAPVARTLRTGPPIIPAAVFGSDTRVALPAHLQAVEEKMGLLFNLRSRTVCTAFCVAKDIIATAGHCLFRTLGERPPPLEAFFFARKFDAVRDFAHIAGHGSGAAAQHVMSGAVGLSVRPPIDATKDWALVRLTRPVCSKGALSLAALSQDEIISEAKAKRLFQVSYHRDFTPWKLAYSSACGVARDFAGADWETIARDFSEPADLILHTCATGGASSGSPLLVATPSGPMVVGINIGTYERSRVIMQAGQVARRLKADMIANTAVSSTSFSNKLEIFQGAVILSTPAQILKLKAALRREGLYEGRADGRYDATLRSAIEAYEMAQGLPITGLASMALLKRLEGERAGAGRGRAVCGGVRQPSCS